MYRKLLEEESNTVSETLQIPPFIREQTYSDTRKNKSRRQIKLFPSDNNNRINHGNTITIDGQMVTVENGDMVAIEDGDMGIITGEGMGDEGDLEEEVGLEQFEGDKVVVEDLGEGVNVVIVGEEAIEDDLGEW